MAKKEEEKQGFRFKRDPRTDLIVLVAIVAVFALLIMFLKFPA